MIKYIILPGWVRSKSDRQLHFINHDKLIINNDLLSLPNKYKHLPI